MAKQGCGTTIEAVWKRAVEAMACNKVLKKNSELRGGTYKVE